MRRLGTCSLVLIIGVGMMVMVGCGGGDGAVSSTLPQSAASYMGSNLPAPIDSTTGSNFYDLYSQLFDSEGVVRTSISGDMQMSGNTTVEGDISGTYKENWSQKVTYVPTGTTSSFKATAVYDNWANSGDGDPSYVIRGSGSRYIENSAVSRYDSEVPEAAVRSANGGVGTYLGAELMDYINFSDFAESTSDLDQDPIDELTAGWASRNFSYTESTGTWSLNQDVNMAYNNFTDDVYLGLLDATATAGYDGSVTTLVASGEYCQEGTGYNGCLTYEIDLQWDGDEDLENTDAMPDDGTISVSTINAVAMFDFSYTSNPLCYLLSVDADNDSAYEYTIVNCEIP